MTFPFNSNRKRMSVIIDYQGASYLFVKGASEYVMKSCKDWYNKESNQVESINEELGRQMDATINDMAMDSLRTLCLAFKKLRPTEDFDTKDEKGVYEVEKNDLILISLVGIQDIPRPEVPQAIQDCHTAGIKVRMVTGDNVVTARAIAKKVGIIREEDKDALVLEGPDFISKIGGVVCMEHKRLVCDECAIDAAQAEKKGLKHVRVDTILNKEAFDELQDKLLVLARSRP